MKIYIEPIPPINLPYYVSGLFRSGKNFRDVLLTSRGRDAIQLAIDLFQISMHDSVLLPALTCDTVSGVFSSNCKTVFFDLKKDYSIDLSILEGLLHKNPEVKIVYIIHYFGFIQKNIHEISSLCKKYNVVLIEDHAHSALSNYDEDLADAHIYSFRKLLPTADGGGIRLNEKQIYYNFRSKHKFFANLKGLLIALKRIGSLYSGKLRSSVGRLIQNDINNLNKGKSRIEPLAVSKFAKGIIQSSDINEISAIRREQYIKWKKIISSTHFPPLFPELGDNTVPSGFPIKLQNNKEVIAHFKTFNVFLKIHWFSMPPDTEDSCPVAHYLANTSITLPIYPGLKDSQMYFIRDELLKHGVPCKEYLKIDF